jgi:hypothetical protein
LNVSQESKTQLKALVKIKKGEPVNIDNLAINEESKQELKELQRQISQGQTPISSNYITACKDCGKSYEVAANPPQC